MYVASAIFWALGIFMHCGGAFAFLVPDSIIFPFYIYIYISLPMLISLVIWGLLMFWMWRGSGVAIFLWLGLSAPFCTALAIVVWLYLMDGKMGIFVLALSLIYIFFYYRAWFCVKDLRKF